jgi:hypothetical protein
MNIRILQLVVAGALTAACLAPLAIGQETPPAEGRGPGRGRGPQGPPPGPTPRLPVDPNLGVNSGKPDLGGKGMWGVPYVTNMQKKTGGVTIEQEPPFTPVGKAYYDNNQATLSKDDPEGHCLPPGIPRMMYTPYPAEILQLPNRIVFIYEGGAHVWRTIWMDGRQHTPIDKLNPTYLGESIGHWEGDTLVTDVIGFNDRTWLDFAGHGHGEKLHVIEKYSRPDSNTLHYEATIEDPDFYTKAWTVPQNIQWRAGQELMEYICQENNRDIQHLVGAGK